MAQELSQEYLSVVEQGRQRYLLDIDNDSLLFKRDDGFYTSGLRLARESILTGIDRAVTWRWQLGQDIYTASDIKLQPEQIMPNDHPYAAWLYVGLSRREDRADGSFREAGLYIGCLGPCAGGRWVQTNLHRVLNQPLPQGWSTQVKNEAGAVLHARAGAPRWNYGGWLDASPGIHGRFGNIYTDAGASLTVRAGRLNLLPVQDAFYAFARLDGRAVAYNATLQGGYFSSGNGRTVQPKRWVGEAELGVAWNSGPYGATAAVVRRSNEVRDLPNSVGAQNFARLQFSYTP